MFSNYNLSSLLLPRVDLEKFLDSIFKSGTTYSLESIITQVVNRFITTRTQLCYGLSDLYTTDDANNTKPKKMNAKVQSRRVNEKLKKIYRLLATESSASSTTQDEAITLDQVKFVMPKVAFTFDTLTSRESGYERTISRISIVSS